MLYYGQYVYVLVLLLYFSNAELILIQKEDEIYCMNSNANNKALTWIPTIEINKQITYKEEVTWMPAKEDLEEFRDLNCDLMRDGGCPLADKFRGSWEIIDNASDDYGFITDHRWHSLPLYNTTGSTREYQRIPITPSKKGHIYMSILAKNNAFLIVTDGEKGFQIKLDAYIRDGIRRSLFYCSRTQSPPFCNREEIAREFGAILNDGKQWTNVKVIIKPKSFDVSITINEVVWNVAYNSPIMRDYRIGQLTNIFIKTANRQMGFWKFHHYRALRPILQGNEMSLDFTTRNNPQLCLSILYHSGEISKQFPTAAKLQINDVSVSSTQFEEHLQAGKIWQEYRNLFYLEIDTHYQLILTPYVAYPFFAIGEIRVCQKKEYLVNKMKYNDKETTCKHLNENTEVIERRLEINAENQFSYACSKDSFGENCDIPCSVLGTESCKGLRVCSARACSCLPGYNGAACENECPGSYGFNCRAKCHHCRNGMQCDFRNGACPNADCEDGYFPGYDELCYNKCRPGTYGHNCKNKCSAFCPLTNLCDYITGSCTRDRCYPDVYVPPTCQYPRFVLSESPQVLKSGVDNIELRIPLQDISEEFKNYTKQVGIQYRLHQATAEWKEGPRFTYSEIPKRITLQGLTPKTTYDIRVILYDEQGNGNVGDQVPILPSVTTLSKPAGSTTMIIIGGSLFLIICLLAFILAFCLYHRITERKLKINTEAPAAAVVEAVAEVVEYAEVDPTKAVALPDPELPPRPPEVSGYLGVLEPYHYDVVRAPQPLQPWIKRPRFGRRKNVPRNVDRDGYEVPISRRNFVPRNVDRDGYEVPISRRNFVPRNVDRDGYEVPISRRNFVPRNVDRDENEVAVAHRNIAESSL